MKLLVGRHSSLLGRYSFRKNSYTTKSPSQVAPVELAFTSHGDITNADSLVVMHGLFGSRGNWNSIAKALVKETKAASLPHKIYLVDARNHGMSPHSAQMDYAHLAADLHHFINQHNLSKPTVLGHSMGGRAAMLLALTKPQVLDKLIVIDISPFRTSPSLNVMGDYFAALRDVQIPPNTPLSQARILADQQLSTRITDKNVRQFLLMNLDTTLPRLWRANVPVIQKNFINNIAEFPLPRGATFEKPALFIAGRNSDYILSDDVTKIGETFKKATFKFVENAGHWVHADQPATLIDHVLTFLATPHSN